jgi:hypothetical protein
MLLAELELPLLPPQASEFAVKYDMMFWYITAVIAVGGGLTFAWARTNSSSSGASFP